MTSRLVLASASEIRQDLLRRAGVSFDIRPALVDEAALREALLEEGAGPRDIADALAELKALKIAAKDPGAIVIGCDQTLGLQGRLLAKPQSVDEARRQLLDLRGKRHELFSAVVLVEAGHPVWRHVGVARLTMRTFSEAWLDGYLDRNWQSIRHSVGAYKLEEEGVRLFSAIEGDYFTVLGLPLLDLLSHLTLRGILET